jgi:nitroreductase
MELCHVLQERRSNRHFSNDPIDRSEIERIISLASWAPSAGNRQPWKVAAVSPPRAKYIIDYFEPLAWEILYSTLRSVIAKDERFIGRKVSNRELTAATVDFVNREIFAKGAPWILVLYSDKITCLNFLHDFYAGISMAVARMMVKRGVWQKMKLLFFLLVSILNVIKIDRKTTVSSFSNYMYNLCLVAHDAGFHSCIQFSYSLIASRIRKHLQLPRNAEILGAVIIGKPQEESSRELARRVSERKPVAVRWS